MLKEPEGCFVDMRRQTNEGCCPVPEATCLQRPGLISSISCALTITTDRGVITLNDMMSLIMSLSSKLTIPERLPSSFLIGLAIVQVITIIFLLLMYRTVRRCGSTKHKKLEVLTSSNNIYEAMGEIAAAKVESLGRRLEDLEKGLGILGTELKSCIRRVGLVRFRAFDDVGCDLSFSMALLDAKSNGVVITSLYGRQESRVYAKPVKEGKSNYPLSPEEIEALHQAMRPNP